ncbi:transmembrane anchor protein [Pseudomonas viridiflava]|uniref:transmembrane anchor protein n=1 Tax=Pseudomonas viridiflava TaxID=33069 RepID=UPI000F03010D|nr:transmembrane anchor protein [Pseudomonas viridiflava]
MFNSPLPTANDLPSTARLLRSTAIAAVVAVGLLVTVVMPSEYAVDPTGLGRVLGLQQMGELKIALANEALAETQAPAVTPSAPVAAEPVATPAAPAVAEAPQPRPATSEMSPTPTMNSNKMTVNLKPGEGAEIKLDMIKGASVRYEWTTSGGTVNFDTHGEPYNGKKGYFHSYSKGKQVNGDSGEFVALFDGTHGWFWRNRSDGPVTIALSTTGEYSKVNQ